MKREVLVSVSGTQTIDDDSGTVEMITPGIYYRRNQKHYILYDETVEEMDDEVTHNTLKVAKDKIEVLKRGAVETSMTFESGKKHLTNFRTPMGLILLGVTTASIAVKEEEDLLQVHIDYALEMNGEPVSDCSLGIEIRSKQEGALHLS